MAKGAEAFRSIGEVAKLIGVAPHVLRYWETQFSLLRPMKRGDGRRYYRPADLALAAGLVELLRDDGLTIRGARMALAPDRGEAVRARGTARLARLVPSCDPDLGNAADEEPSPVAAALQPDDFGTADSLNGAATLGGNAVVPPMSAPGNDAKLVEPAVSAALPLQNSTPAGGPEPRPMQMQGAEWLAWLTHFARRLQRVETFETASGALHDAALRLARTMLRLS